MTYRYQKEKNTKLSLRWLIEDQNKAKEIPGPFRALSDDIKVQISI